MNFLKNKYLLVGMLLVVVGVFAFMLFAKDSDGLEYSPKRANNRAGPIVIKASSPINPEGGSYTIKPSVGGSLQVVDNFIIFWPKDGVGFIEDTQYTATFSGYRTSSGIALKIPTLSFRVDRNTDYSQLQKDVLSKYGRFEDSTNPFLQKLPHTEAYRYRVSYAINELPGNEGKDIHEILGNEQNWREKRANYTVIIETLVVQGRQDSFETYKQEVLLARKEALDWISKQGVDISKDILYEFVPNDQALMVPGGRDPEIEI